MADTSCTMRKLRVLELYSGIGGMHWALKEIDIKETGISFLQCNFDEPSLPAIYTSWEKADCDDVRTKSFLHVLQLVKGLDAKPQYILVENVKGFETSRTRRLLVDMLQTCGYAFQEFLLNPLQFGVPNGRLRYYLTARLTPWPQSFKPEEKILHSLPELWSQSSQPGHDVNTKTVNSSHTGQRGGSCFYQSQSQHQEKLSSGQSDKDSSHLCNLCKDGLGRESESGEEATAKGSVLCQSCSCSAKHSFDSKDDDDNNVRSDIKRFKSNKSIDAHLHTKDSNCASERQPMISSGKGEVIDLLNAGRNMRYCEEEDAFIKSDSFPLSNYMESGDEEDFKAYLLPDKSLFLFIVMDVVLPVLKKSTCFTKRYGHYIEGAGSVVQMSSSVEATKAASALKTRTVDLRNKHEWQEEELSIIRKLKLRYFTPREVANLLCFPSEFTFPDGFSNVQKYRVLGNSLNVHVVSRLIKFMVAT